MIKSFTLNNFTGFKENTFTFNEGVNVFIGKNGTGKTHVMKAMASILHARHDFGNKATEAKEQFEYLLAESLISFFKPDKLGNLVNKINKSINANLSITIDEQKLTYNFNSSAKTTVKLEEDGKWSDKSFVYIPPREMFSLYEGFIGLISKREISLDQTYLNFAQSLAIPTLKDIEKNPLKDAINLLEKELNFKVIQKNGRFYIQNESGELEAHLVAEGLRKLASILYLILNGEINKNTILFWDEPESNLNPALIKVVAKFIITLQKHGIQIFIATHDYLLTHILSLYSEYSDDKALPVCFFSLTKEDADIIIEKGYTLSEIENNSILDEYAAYYDLQHKFMTGNYE